MKALFFFLLICQTSFLLADTGAKKFCEDLLDHNSKSSKPSQNQELKAPTLRFYLNYFINPKSLVKIDSLLKRDLDDVTENIEGDKYLINLLPETSFSDEEKSELTLINNDFQLETKAFNAENFKVLRGLKDMETCQIFYKEKKVDSFLAKTEQLYQRYSLLKQKQSDANTARLFHKQARSFKRKGWRVVADLSINEIHSLITLNPRATFMFVAHATPDGEIVDKDLNTIPSTFFKNTQIQNLVIFSCFGKQVVKNYGLAKLKHLKNYYYPTLSPLSDKFLPESKTPLNALRAVLKVQFVTSPDENDPFTCRLNFENSSNRMSVFLNKVFFGEKMSELRFDCQILKDSNVVEIYNITNTKVLAVSESESVLINGDQSIKLRTFSSKVTGSHIVTKGQFKTETNSYGE